MDKVGEWHIERYRPTDSKVWDRFVKDSRNGTFLLTRPYLDYHSDRFTDHSLLAYRNGRLRALLPANIDADGILHSHQGLTYGGWVTPRAHFDATDMLALWDCLRQQAPQMGIRGLDYKPVPGFYTDIPAEEDLYALFRQGAVMTECNVSSLIDRRSPKGFNTLQRRHLRKAEATGAVIREGIEPERFHALLSECLRERHGASPVHSCAELQLLQSRFPGEIRLFGAELDGKLEAGVCIYDTGRVAHCQYICSTPEGRRLGLLTLLFYHLIRERYAERRYFDFGTSNENHGLLLNTGLLSQKAALGGSAAVQTRWSVDFTKQ